MTTDVDAFSQLLQTGLITAVVNIISFVGVFVVLCFLSPPLDARRARAGAAARHRARCGSAGGRRAPTPHARETISTVNAEFQESLSGVAVAQAYVREDRNIDSFHRTARPLPRRPAAHPAAPGALLPVHPVPRDVRRRDRARPRQRARARRHGRRRHGDRLPALPRPVLRADPAALAGVRPVAAGGRLDGPSIDELMATPVLTPDARRPGRAGHACAATIRFEDVDFRTRAPAARRCTASTSTSQAGETRRAGRRDRRGQVDHREAGRPLLRPDRRPVLVDGVAGRPTSTCARSAASSATCPRSRSCSPAPSATTSPTAVPTPPTPRSRRPRARGRRARVRRRASRRVPPPRVTERGRSLSAGQRQLICLARALLVDPSILLLDEATANLDLATEARVQRAMGVVSHGRTTLLIAHRLPTARTADRIVVVDDGRVVEQGSHDELLARGGRAPVRRARGTRTPPDALGLAGVRRRARPARSPRRRQPRPPPRGGVLAGSSIL